MWRMSHLQLLPSDLRHICSARSHIYVRIRVVRQRLRESCRIRVLTRSRARRARGTTRGGNERLAELIRTHEPLVSSRARRRTPVSGSGHWIKVRIKVRIQR
eukprot:COSAG02_NODE_5608_length_4191_cov_3.152493_1_plen_102_part_00